MKKLYYLLLIALPVLCFASCDDNDKNLPDVEVSIKVDGGVSVDGVLYVVQGDTLNVKCVDVTNREQGKEALITSAAYTWDYTFLGVSVTPPFGVKIATDQISLGDHLLQITCPVFAVDKTPAKLYMAYKVDIVESTDDIPTGEAITEFKIDPGVQEN